MDSRIAIVVLAAVGAAPFAGAVEEYPTDPAKVVAEVRAGRLPPIAPWKRFEGKIPVPAFGARPAEDALNPGGPNSGPADGGTLVVQYNSAPKHLNGITDNSAIVTYIEELFAPYLIRQDRVDFSYGRPSAEDPVHVFDSVNPHDCAVRFVKEDTLALEDGRRLFGAVSEGPEGWVVTPVAQVEGEKRLVVKVPKSPGDKVLRGTFITVFLRKEVKWHDGAPFTAEDVEFTVKAIQNPLVNSDNVKTYFEMVMECRALDPSTLRWILDRQYFACDDTTVGGNLRTAPLHAYRAAYAADKEFADKPFDPASPEFARFFNNCTALSEKPVGTGPYRVAEFNQSRSVVLERNPLYFGPRGHADRIVWKFINDPVPALQALQSGEVDFAAHGPTPELYTSVMADPKFQEKNVRAHWFTPAFAFVSWNLTRDCLKDARVRAALALLADRPSFVKNKQHGISVLVSGDQFISGPAYDPEVKPLAFDPAAAEEILDEAGWYDRDDDGIRDKDGKKLTFNLLIPSGSKTMKEFAPVWQESLKKAGVEMKVGELDWAAFVDRFDSKNFDAISLQYAMDPESDPHQLWHSSWTDASKRQPNTFGDARVDALIEAARPCLDREERFRYQRALHRYLDAEQPFVFLWATPEIAGYARRWKGVRLYPKRPGFDLTEWYLPKEAQGGR